MTTYALVKNGIVQEVFPVPPTMTILPVEKLFAPGTFDAFVKIDGLNPQPGYGWQYDGKSFSPPAPDVPPWEVEQHNAATQTAAKPGS